MPQTTKTSNAPQGELKFNGNALKNLATQYGIRNRTIMSIFGQTNPTTVSNWMSGADLSMGSVVSICNAFRLDVLQFITYYGHTFKSCIDDLHRLESCGLTVADILRERGIETYIETDGAHKVRSTGDIEEEMAKREDTCKRMIKQNDVYIERMKMERATQISSPDIIEQISKIHQQCHEHETKELEKLRTQKDQEIQELQNTIINLKIALGRMGYHDMLWSDKKNVADETTVE